MATKDIPIAEATASQLAEFASTQYGLDVRHTTGHTKIVQALQAIGYDKETIAVTVEDAAPAAPEGRKMVKILIQAQPGVGGKDHVPIGHNGKWYRIMRGKPVDVPEEIIGVLNDAQTVEFDKGPNGEPINPRMVPKFPWSIVSAA